MTVRETYWCLLVSFLMYSLVLTRAERETTTVETNVGTFNGYIYRVNALGENLVTRRFFGIPYAEPPTGDLRFKKPVKKAKLLEPLDVTQFAPSCLQQSVIMAGTRNPKGADKISLSEDCLYLNIFTPFDDDRQSSSEGLSVMIYFHGGGFVIGSPVPIVADIFSAYGNVIVVTVAYRLSVWGFLSTGDENLPGNYGLFDQEMAIKWVYGNIGAFGGNPESISLFGSSAGGASVVCQSLYPGNAGIVKRIIAQGGSITNPWAFNDKPIGPTKRIGKLVGCPMEDSKELADCLRTVSSDKLNEVLDDKGNGFVRFPMEFVTVVDGDFIPDSPHNLLHSDSNLVQPYQATMSNIDLMTGVVAGEGLMMLTSFVGIEDTFGYQTNRDDFESNLIPEVVRVMFGENVPDVINDIIIGEYTDWSDPDNSSSARDAFINLSNDYVFNIQTVEIARRHTRTSKKNTFVYLYDAVPTQRILPMPSWSTKPCHVDEMTTLLGYDENDGYTQWTTPYPAIPPEPWEIELTKTHITLWTNFAKSGDPNTPVNVKPFTKTDWPKYEATSQKYLIISDKMTDNSVGGMFCARAFNFWNQILPRVITTVSPNAGNKRVDNMYCARDGECKP